MPLKYVGAILIFLACGAAGFLMAAGYRKEERSLSELVRVLDFMSCELEYRLTPLPQVCRSAANSAQGCIQKVLGALAVELENQISPNAACCMQVALSAAKDMPPSVYGAFQALGESLGCYDLDGQLKQLAAVRQQCAAKLTQMQSDGEERIRRYQTLGLCAGAGLAILFL